MSRFLRYHPEAVLVALALVFLIILFGFYFWGINDVVVVVNTALNQATPQQNMGFDFTTAQNLHWYGLVSTSTGL